MLGFAVLSLLVPKITLAADSLIKNGDFSSDELNPWWGSPSEGAEAQASVVDGMAELAITDGGTADWHVMLGYSGVPIVEGTTYEVSFKAKADKAVSVPFLWQEAADPYTTYFGKTVALTTELKEYKYSFTSEYSDSAADFAFQAGALGAFTMWLDDVVIIPTATGGLPNQIKNGDFSDGNTNWKFNAYADNGGEATFTTTDEILQADVTKGGTDGWVVSVEYPQLEVAEGEAYTLTLSASGTAGKRLYVSLQDATTYVAYLSDVITFPTISTNRAAPQPYEFSFVSEDTNRNMTLQLEIGGQDALTVTLDDISLVGNPPAPIVEAPPPTIRVNQVGYFPLGAKRATVSNTVTTPLDWQLLNADSAVVLSGTTAVLGDDAASGDHVHTIDFSSYTQTGISYTLKISDEVSYPFDISEGLYSQLKYDALAYFYHARSGIAIEQQYVDVPFVYTDTMFTQTDMWTRPAGHVSQGDNQGDTSVPCFVGNSATPAIAWSGQCTFADGTPYNRDVTGGWYDAGDYGKYVVNGGITVWTLQNMVERNQHVSHADSSTFADGTLQIPENNNNIPDILDELRWELEWLLKMQVPAGATIERYNSDTQQPELVDYLGGMVHHKMHSAGYGDMGEAAHEDAKARHLIPPSTGATLNFAAVMAQASRIWQDIDADFAAQCLTAAETAWQAAQNHPTEYAGVVTFDGGGPYDDNDMTDEFYWAAAELFITTGKTEYQTYLTNSPHFLSVAEYVGEHGSRAFSPMTWQDTQTLGTLSLAMVPNSLTATLVQQAQTNVVSAAKIYVDTTSAEGYGTPFKLSEHPVQGTAYPWGSNSFVANVMLLMGVAYDFTADETYLNGTVAGMDYLLGRNALVQSYVVGYGERPFRNPHHAFFSHQADANYPPPPRGLLAGGPNSGFDEYDPYITILAGCKPQKCFADDIQSYSTNEPTIDLHAPYVWVTAFLDERSSFETPEKKDKVSLPIIVK
ncbi:glycoside hydrolase family 9 protein [Anaerolineales bacterium HSG6]|nr:glycoside hydrolase family 9 protein [Anaerolineales bacterium HSG6]